MQDLFTSIGQLIQAWWQNNWLGAIIWLIFIAVVAVFLVHETRIKDDCEDDLGFQSLWEARIKQRILYPDREHAKLLYPIYLRSIDEIHAQTATIETKQVESEEKND